MIENTCDVVELPSDPNTWGEAIDGANFVAFCPKVLNDLTIEQVVYRPEDSKRFYPRSSLKIHLTSPLRTLCIKQFNYDWGPPAYGCPSPGKLHEEMI